MQFTIPHDHPALPGHFPGNPLVPGVVILDQVAAAVVQALPGWRVAGIRKLKFLRPLRPGQPCSVACAGVKDGRVRFRCTVGDALVAEGNLELAPA
jgi:3-hydroxyacyl-[acyl-carrier-protein] dehydratase